SSGGSGSIAARFRSTFDAGFDQRVKLDLQLLVLLIGLCLDLPRRALRLWPATGEELGQSLTVLEFSMGDPDGMQPGGGIRLGQRLLFLQDVERYLGVGHGILAVPLCFCDPSLLQDSSTAYRHVRY